MRGHIFSAIVIVCSIIVTLGLLIVFSKVNATSSKRTIGFIPQQIQTVNVIPGQQQATPITLKATTLPQFIFHLVDDKFQNFWATNEPQKVTMISTKIANLKNDTQITTKVNFNNKKKEVIITPQIANSIKPGLYTVSVRVKTYNDKDVTVTQDFRWGVLAINTDKAIYQPGENVKVGIAVLGDLGDTKCIAKGDIAYDTAKVWLEIISPTGEKQSLSTDGGMIVGSASCAPTSVTDNPDFQATITAREVGRYTLHVTAQTIRGTRSIDDYFTVQTAAPDFEIMRTQYPTRIYPYGHYPVEITVAANRDYSGPISDYVPMNFIITNISGSGKTSKEQSYQRIDWMVNWKQGESHILSYEIQFPLVSPEFYLVGPLTIGDPDMSYTFQEGREWQIASDAISLIQSASNVVNSGTSVSATFTTPVTNTDLEIAICSETGSATINTISRGTGRSWSGPTTLSVTSTPRVRMFYKEANATEPTTISCPFSSSSGVKAIQIFEYSGIATSGQLDGHGKLNGSTNNCNTSPFQAAVSLTATNGNELIISSHVATSPTIRNVVSHTSGFAQEFAFNGASAGTFTSADQTISDAGSYTDMVTFSGSAGTCSAVIASFITPVTLTQNGYRFFQNADSTTPGSPIDLQNKNITLTQQHEPFRLRFLIDVDGNQTVTIGGLDFILQYALAPGSGDCSTLQDSDWNPITSSTPIAYHTNPSSGGSGSLISSSGNDPTDTSPHAYTTTVENYYESFSGDGSDDISNLQNALSNNLAGLWDVSLIDNTNDLQAATYCLELVNGDGTGLVSSDLDSYLQYPKVTTFSNGINIRSGANLRSGTNLF